MTATDDLDGLGAALAAVVEANKPSGVFVVRHGDRSIFEHVGGLADRAEGRPITIDTRLATASGTKGFTALTVASLVEDGQLDFSTTVRSVVGDATPLVDPDVTVEHLLGHTSGIGDYLDEETLGDIDEYVLDVPVHRLLGPRDYLPMINRYPQVRPPGEKFTYNNGGYIVLALVIEAVTGQPYHDEVRRRVFDAADLAHTGFLRSDSLPAGTAVGYLKDGRTNIFHLPVIGTGDGGAYTTANDMFRFWAALHDGRIVGTDLVRRMTTPSPHSLADDQPGYGLGFWLGQGSTVSLVGMDAGVSLVSGVRRDAELSYCFIANNSEDVWPFERAISDRV